MKLTAEESVILLTCRPYLDEQADAALRRVATSKTDWAYVLWRAEFFRTLPLLRYHLERVGRLETVPETARAYLQQWSALSATRSQVLYGELCVLLDALAESRVDYQLIKGGALAQRLYPDPLLRPMMDLDVMIYPWAIGKAKRLMRRLGYVHGLWDPRNNRITRVQYGYTDLGQHHELPTFLKVAAAPSPVPASLVPMSWRKRHIKVFPSEPLASFPVFVDLHLNLSIGFDLADVWRGVETVKVLDREARVQSWTTMLWFLAARLYHEAFEFNTLKLIMFGDVQTILQRVPERIDWGELLRIAEKYSMHAPLFYVLAQAAQFTRVAVPDEVLAQLRPDHAGVPVRSDFGDVIPKLLSRPIVQELSFA